VTKSGHDTDAQEDDMARIALMLMLSAMVGFGQPSDPTNAKVTNVDFSEGEIGKIPPGWSVPPLVLAAGYTAELRRGDCPDHFPVCVLFKSPAKITTVRAEELAQTFPALPYLGKKIRFSAWLRAQGFGRGDVELRMRVDYANGKVEFFDSPNGPVDAAESQRRTVSGSVGPDAVYVSIWARFHPVGPGWFADPSFGIVEEPPGRAVEKTGSR
jgi:hypothetical protein